MKLSISNIGWDAKKDIGIYKLMQRYGYSGLEIAPTRVFEEKPYDKREQAKQWSEGLQKKYGFEISSMQSIWFGRNEKLFGSSQEREVLIDYTKKAIDFASAVGCHNLVFGCPRNRFFSKGADWSIGVAFFKKIGDYAFSKGTVIGMEANPPIYNTNFINDTKSALELIEEVDSQGYLLNLDVGTMIQNNESIDVLYNKIKWINHIHISEPNLKPIQQRKLHGELCAFLKENMYQNFISIEMGKIEDMEQMEKIMQYVQEVFG